MASGYLLPKLSFDIEAPLLGDYEEVPVTVVHSPPLHGDVTGVDMDSYPVPGLTVPRS